MTEEKRTTLGIVDGDRSALGIASPDVTIKKIETWTGEIVEKLKSDIPDATIEDYPDKPASYIFRHPVAALLVRYAGSSFSSPLPTDIVSQDQVPEFEITILTRSLRTSNTGAYSFLEKVRASLTGFKPEGCSKMYPTKEQFEREEDGEWEHSVTFLTSTKHTEAVRGRQMIEYTDQGYLDEI